MSQAAVALVPAQDIGKGYGSTEVYQAHLARVRELIQRTDPNLKARAVEAAKAIARARLDLEAAKHEIRRIAGDFTNDAMVMITQEAEAELALQLRSAELRPEALK